MRGFITIMDSLSPKLSANTQEPGNEAISPLAPFLQGWPASFIYECKVYVLNVKLWFQFRRLQYMVVIPDHQVLPTREVELAWKKWERTYNVAVFGSVVSLCTSKHHSANLSLYKVRLTHSRICMHYACTQTIWDQVCATELWTIW